MYYMAMNEKPLKIIEPPAYFNPIAEIREIWRHRELLYLLAWRDYKVRYKQTLIGVAWAVFQPVAATLAFVFIFGKFNEIADNGVNYPLFVYSGFVIWQFFANSVAEAATSLVVSSQMITKIYFPRIIVPLAKILTQYIDLLISLVILTVMMVYFRTSPSLLGLLSIVPILILLGLISASVGAVLSAFNVKFRDVQYALPFLIQLGLFASPVIYSASSLGRYRDLIYLNPVSGIIDLFRSALFGLPFSPPAVGISFAVALFIFVGGLYYFIKAEGAFSDVI